MPGCAPKPGTTRITLQAGSGFRHPIRRRGFQFWKWPPKFDDHAGHLLQGVCHHCDSNRSPSEYGSFLSGPVRTTADRSRHSSGSQHRPERPQRLAASGCCRRGPDRRSRVSAAVIAAPPGHRKRNKPLRPDGSAYCAAAVYDGPTVTRVHDPLSAWTLMRAPMVQAPQLDFNWRLRPCLHRRWYRACP